MLEKAKQLMAATWNALAGVLTGNTLAKALVAALIGALFGALFANTLHHDEYSIFKFENVCSEVFLWSGCFVFLYVAGHAIRMLLISASIEEKRLARNILLVLIFGAIGGIVSPMMAAKDQKNGGANGNHSSRRLMLVGALAALGGTTVILNRELGNPDVNKLAQTLGYAVICGIAWPIVMNSFGGILGQPSITDVTATGIDAMDSATADLSKASANITSGAPPGDAGQAQASTEKTGDTIRKISSIIDIALPSVEDPKVIEKFAQKSNELAATAIQFTQDVAQSAPGDSEFTAKSLRNLDSDLGALETSAAASKDLQTVADTLRQAPPRIYIQHCGDLEGATALRDVLDAQKADKKWSEFGGIVLPGLEDICDEIGPKGTPPSQPEVRYFRPEDQKISEALITMLNEHFQFTPPTSAFGSLIRSATPPRSGTIEIWLARKPS